MAVCCNGSHWCQDYLGTCMPLTKRVRSSLFFTMISQLKVGVSLLLTTSDNNIAVDLYSFFQKVLVSLGYSILTFIN